MNIVCGFLFRGSHSHLCSFFSRIDINCPSFLFTIKLSQMLWSSSYLSTQKRTLVVLVRLQSLLIFKPPLFHDFSCFSKLYWIFFAFQDNSSETWDFLAPCVWKKHDTKQSDGKNWKVKYQTQGAKTITLFVFLLQSYPGEERIGVVGLETCALLGQQTSPKGKRG